MFCENCEALGESCCEASKERRETANRLANLVARQATRIKELLIERDAARVIVADLMARNAV